MRQTTIVFAFLFIGVLGSANLMSQNALSDSLSADRINRNRNNMSILAAWAGVNIIQGSISANNATGSGKYFFQMNTYWNLINLGISSWGLIQVRKELSKKYSFAESFQAQQKLEKLLLLNAALDLGYITTGLYLQERGRRLSKDQGIGFGNSLVLQGAFLLIFDLIQYGNHRRNGKLFDQALGKLQLSAASNGIGLTYPLN
ncbi:MAG: hypothetical protein EAZ13_09920 [Sphingobacteriia bacterium]|nr:MAG: hypothetical protein EAZ41_02365 [Sphingobacteriia bacterium]TAG29287.1 MAG: hypothetical protein EAZ35_11185 [Sphingobacteriia bacterium]TAH06299.1 MAG: hypothetical protein EAZ13_09920 [Sphingobacteriia bacterium]